MKKLAALAAAAGSALLLVVSMGAAPSASKKALTCNCVAFRLDDIQDYFLDHLQIEVMEVFQKRDTSMTVGVIGNYFGGDPMIVNYVKGRAGDTGYEVANHGWDHDDFTMFSKQEQSTLMEKTNTRLFDLLGKRPTVFIAPFNIVNNDTFDAAKENHIRYISANAMYDPPPYHIGNSQSLYRLPQTALMGDLNADDTEWVTFGHERVLGEVEKSLDQHGFAVVTLHPQDFDVRDMLNHQNMADSSKIKELETLLDKIQERGIKIVTIKEIPGYFASDVSASRPSKEDLASG